MERIQRQRGDMSRDAVLILSWIINARRQMTVPELQEALAVEIGKPALDKDNIPTAEHMIKACAPLVVIDEESNIIRLVHYTAQEYLERRQNVWFESAQADIARISVTYLSFAAFGSGISSSSEIPDKMDTYKLYHYAVENWGHHAREALSQGMEVPELVDFLQSDEKREAAWVMAHPPKFSFNRLPGQVTALHLVGYFGLYETAVLFLAQGYPPDAKNKDGRTPLWWAARNGQASVVELLLEKRPNLESKDSFGLTPLASAAKNGYADVVRLLLQKGAHPDSQAELDHQTQEPRSEGYWECEDRQTPLSWASMNGHEEAVGLLLRGKANLEVKDHNGATPLAWASRNGTTQSRVFCSITGLM
ncbi:hypothetical protein MFIFM68171_00343 [Madurella fahalii]|uniref:GPI inositol-deacylase winged helix domain-containing protein n=1 Tax=Madurella fahalii TaxID=1157608 RepID=A0ABQ0FXA8_9PEZI